MTISQKDGGPIPPSKSIQNLKINLNFNYYFILSLPELSQTYKNTHTIAQLSCGLIEDLLIRPLLRTGRLSPDDLSTIQQVQGVISMLGKKAGTLEDLLEGQPHQDSVNQYNLKKFKEFQEK